MKQNFTKNDLVRFIYNETSNPETNQLIDAINSDDEFYAQYAELKSAKSLLPKATFAPTPRAIQNILRYSSETALEAQF